MFNRVFQLFKIARKLATSGAITTINEIYDVPSSIKILFNIISIGANKNLQNINRKPGANL